MPRHNTDRHSRDVPSNASVEESRIPVSTKMIVELSSLDRYTPFARRVERLFHDSWTDRTKTSHLEEIILFDIKTFPSRPDGQTPGTFKTASRDVELLTRLEDFLLCFYGARRACYIGDPSHPLRLCRSVECAICSVFQAQYTAREAGMRFELGPGLLTTPRSSEADGFTTNHHIRSPQHAMILCACPNIVRHFDQGIAHTNILQTQADTQTMAPGAPSPYTASVSRGTTVVPIGLIMYTRTGWHPS